MPDDASHEGAAGAKPPSDPCQTLKAELLRQLMAHDKGAAVAAVLRAVREEGVPLADVYERVLGPALVEIGALWQVGRVAVWEEHLASATVRTIVECLYPDVARHCSGGSEARSALLACPPEEAHDLGLRMLADRLTLAGWRVCFLGADTPPDEIMAAARSLGVDAVMLSSSTHYHRLCLRELVDRLEAALPGVSVWAGGPAFRAAADDWSAAHRCPEDDVFGRGGDGSSAC